VKEQRFDGQVVLVTGAGRGIGRSVAAGLAERGARVYLCARSEDQLEEAVTEITKGGGTASAIAVDVSSEAGVASLFGRIRGEAGRLDVLINNAGVGVFKPLASTTVEEFDHVQNVNVRGAFLCCKAALELMVPQKEGTIINIGSVVSFKGYPDQSAYAASKHALLGLTKSLAVEAQPCGIRVSAILPGGVDTDLITAARPDLDRSGLMQPEDITYTVFYLLGLPKRAAVDQIYIRRGAGTPF